MYILNNNKILSLLYINHFPLPNLSQSRAIQLTFINLFAVNFFFEKYLLAFQLTLHLGCGHLQRILKNDLIFQRDMITFLAKKKNDNGLQIFFFSYKRYTMQNFSAKHFKLVYNHKIIKKICSSDYDHICLFKAND